MSTLNNARLLKKYLFGVLLVAAAAGLVLLALQLFSGGPETARAGTEAISAASPLPGTAGGQGSGQVQARSHAGLPAPASGSAWFDAASPAMSSPHSPVTVSPLSTMSPPQFAADGRGKLILNPDTHANLEKLLLEENPATMQATLATIQSRLPLKAAAELKALVGQFQQYSKALTHSISPEQAPETAQEGFKLLDSLHRLRVSYLGPETARAMFGPEEATTRQLIALMEADKDASLTPQQKAERAQDILNRQAPPPG